MVRVPRRRYLALAAEPPVPGHALTPGVLAELERLSSSLAPPKEAPRLYHLGPGKVVARVDHRAQGAARAALDGAQVAGARLRTVAASGTLRQAKAALGVRTASRRRPRRRPRAPGGSAGTRRA